MLEQVARATGDPTACQLRSERNLGVGERRRTCIAISLLQELDDSCLVGAKGEDRVCLIITPLYLDFVEILFCRYDPDVGIREAWHKWLAHTTDVAACATEVGVAMTEGLLPQVVEELAHAVVADRRAGRTAPPSLVRYIDLFAPDLAHPVKVDE